MKDTYHDNKAVQALAPAVVSATTSGSAIDLSGFDSALVVINTGAIVGAGLFAVKLQERNQRHDANRETAARRGYGHEWRKARAEFLIAHPYCRECTKHGVTRMATVVDHVIPHRGDKGLFWHRANWQPLCEPCHNSVKQRMERAR